MDESPTTRITLLARLRDLRDGAAWEEFVEIYAPLIYGLARRHALQDADAGDVTQEVLRAAVQALPRFALDPRRGTFRGWLFTVALNQLRKFAQARKRHPRGSGDPSAQAFLEEQPAPEEEARWEQEYQARLFTWAADKARSSFRTPTWEAFWRTAVDGRDAREVAVALGMSIGAVYIAKSRVLSRIRAIIEDIEILQGK
jgi:RNA polymerase sigma-70 factor (ECF subfamily)